MVVYAQQGPRGPSASEEGMGGTTNEIHWAPKFNMEDMAAFADARIAALHAGLKLNADQEKNWPNFEQSLRDLMKMRTEASAAEPEQQRSTDPVMRLQHLADALSAHGAILKHIVDTLTPLYQSFDDGQKRRFTVLARFMRPGSQYSSDNFHGGPHHFGRGERMRD
jgi:zinc resistance-associated protein